MVAALPVMGKLEAEALKAAPDTQHVVMWKETEHKHPNALTCFVSEVIIHRVKNEKAKLSDHVSSTDMITR